jgi:hypothetical protein
LNPSSHGFGNDQRLSDSGFSFGSPWEGEIIGVLDFEINLALQELHIKIVQLPLQFLHTPKI